MLEIKDNAVIFYAHYTNAGASAIGLTVTIDIYEVLRDGTTAQIVNNGACTEIGDGMYRYLLAGVDVDEEAEYVGVFNTAGVVDAQNIPAIWYINRAGLDMPVSDVAADISSITTKLTALRNMLISTPVILNYIKETAITIKRTANAYWEMRYLDDLTAATAIYFTVKKTEEIDSKDDPHAVLQISRDGGLIVLNGVTPSNPALASLVVIDAASGYISITIDAEATKELDPDTPYKYDIKVDNDIVAQGDFFVSSAVTWTVTP